MLSPSTNKAAFSSSPYPDEPENVAMVAFVNKVEDMSGSYTCIYKYATLINLTVQALPHKR